MTFDPAVQRFLYEHLLDERGLEPQTVEDYWNLHQRWFSRTLGTPLLRGLTRPMFDARFGEMRRDATVLFWRPQVAWFVDERPLLPVLQPFAPASNVIGRFPDALEQVLTGHDLPADFVASETQRWATTGSSRHRTAACSGS